MSYYSSGNSFHKSNPVILNLVIINVLAYLAQVLITSFNITQWGALHYFKSTLFYPHQLVTNFFLHDPKDINHLVFNMLSLFIFGVMLERAWGSKRFLFFYMACGLGASLITELGIPFMAQQFAGSKEALQYGGNIPAVVDAYKEFYSAIGASGAILGVEAAFVYLFPNALLSFFLIPIPIKAKYVIPVFMLIDVFALTRRIPGDNVGHLAHIGGAITGFIIVIIWNRTKKTFY